ncbi:4'-phosphopantetheinyl transferase superfamily protein [Gilvimarinus sp. DA14]|uniref:4'-phosphopantetheinyl transferase family protein n=1 Tax=Gilvimarinus sp. DA14 TaxID=2956798 RepID=UPI0020B6783C|nr:4'-phosphopantetheinyl transferase superfamily protein [Gilvimarinus sp. DA14]UTF59718.1 4'-phosphopantetheinyl transferase superfamily protein [Gilvimarinus sp. DA14]
MSTTIYLSELANLASHCEPEKIRKLLPSSECQKAERFNSPAAKLRFLAGRLMCRTLLSRELSLAPADINIAISDQGKPILDHSGGVHFNLSHSGDWLALGISCCGPLGIDLEQAQKKRPWLAIAKQFFTSAEVEKLSFLNEAALEREFYRLWTLKEAFFKARGTGLAEGLAKVDFSNSTNPQAPEELKPDKWRGEHWPPQLLSTEHTYLACIHQSAETPKLIHWSLPAQTV